MQTTNTLNGTKLVVAATAMIAFSTLAFGQTYSVKNLGTLGGDYSSVSGINSLGELAGTSTTATGLTHAFFYSAGVMKDLGTLGGNESVATGIADTGIVVGWATTAIDAQHATIWSGSKVTDIDPVGGSHYSIAAGVSSNGQHIAGATVGSDGEQGAAIWTGNSLVYVGGAESTATGINNSGEAIGIEGSSAIAYIINTLTNTYQPSYLNFFAEAIGNSGQLVGGTNGEVAISGIPSIANPGPLPGFTGSMALALNDNGQVVGYSNNATGSHATLWSGTTTLDLNTIITATLPPNVTLIEAVAINDSGQIAANAVDSVTGRTQAYLLTPATDHSPTVAPQISGTKGTNGWYVSATKLSWTVKGNPAPETIGCATISMPDTKGTKYTCSATNALGSASDSVTIKKDTVAPQVTIKTPMQGSKYALNAKVLASYSCVDATSGVDTCMGTVKGGAEINTSTKGTQKFMVTGTDNAGNSKTIDVSYTVN